MKRFHGLGPRQEEVLRQIVFGHNGDGCPPRILRALESKGLIVGYDDKLYGPSNSPIDQIPMRVRRYQVTLPMHMEYCAWCAEQEDNT